MAARKYYLEMIRAFPGGWEAMAGALGMTKDALENRIYERKGQSLHVQTAMQMQAFSGTTHFAEGVAQESGGVFMKLPDAGEVGNDELLKEFNCLYSELGELSAKFNAFTADDVITPTERAELDAVGQHIHRTVTELLALTYRVYCKPEQS